MKSHLVLLLPFLLLALTEEGNSQRLNRFIVNIVTTANEVLCVGTVITENHVLAPASCVSNVQNLMVQFGIQGIQHVSGKKQSVPVFIIKLKSYVSVAVHRVFTHPDYVAAQDRGSNVAVVQVSFKSSKNTTIF